MTTSDGGPLARLDQARQLLAQARSVDEVKLLRDQAEMMRMYARERDMGIEAQNSAAEIKIRAERRLGEMLRPQEAEKQEGAVRIKRQPRGRPKKKTYHADRFSSNPPRLSDLGLTELESSRFQVIATVPEEVFEEHIAAVKADDREITTAGVLRLAAQRQAEQDTATADRIFTAGMALDPAGEDRYRQAQLRSNFARALSKADDLLALRPQMVVPVLEPRDLEAGRRYIQRFAAWVEDFESASATHLRLVEDS